MGYSSGRLVGCVMTVFSVVSVVSLSVSSVGSLARTSLFLSENRSSRSDCRDEVRVISPRTVPPLNRRDKSRETTNFRAVEYGSRG